MDLSSTWSFTEERINVKAIKALMQKKAAAAFRPAGMGPSVRRIMGDFVQRSKAGVIQNVWRDEGSKGMTGRRYSGSAAVVLREALEDFKNNPPETEADKGKPKKPAALVKLELIVKTCEKEHISPSGMGASSFALPKYLRHVARSELPGCYVLDLVNAHPSIVHQRHPDLKFIANYVTNRDAWLKAVGTSRDDAKNLMIRLLYAGSLEAWEGEMNIRLPDPLRGSIVGYAADLAKARIRDRVVNATELTLPDNVRQYQLNTAEERRAINQIELALKAHCNAKIMAYEHDGLFFESAEPLSKLLEVADGASPYRVTIEECTHTTESALAAVLDRIKSDKVQSVFSKLWIDDGAWQYQLQLIREAMNTSLQHHGLFALVVKHAVVISPSLPYNVTEVFKVNPLQEKYMWYSHKLRHWLEGGPHGCTALKGAIQTILQMELSEYTFIKDEIYQDPGQLRWDVTNTSFRNGVECSLREHLLVSDGFVLDPESSLRYLNFNGMCYDRRADKGMY
jgi:hypothetical protein